MSSVEDFGGDETAAVEQFWETSDLVETLLPYLDLNSTKQLVVSHKLTRQMLRKAFIWRKLVQRMLPTTEEKINFCCDIFGMPFSFEDDPLLESERQKAKILAETLTLVKVDSLTELELVLVLIHAIVERNPPVLTNLRTRSPVTIDLRCSCLETHMVSPWGFMLLVEVEASLGSSMLEVDSAKMVTLKGPLSLVLASKAAGQQGIVKKLDVGVFVCDTDESAEAMATLVEQSNLASAREENSIRIGTEEIGMEGWAAVRRAVERLRNTFGIDVELSSDPETMGAGRYEDLKATWDNVWEWLVHDEGYGGAFTFRKEFDGEEAWWDRRGFRRGLEAFIDMTEEEWLAEVRRFEGAFAEANAEAGVQAEAEADEDVFGPE